MGTIGAIYYGGELNGKGINVGKGLVNVGRIGENMKLLGGNDLESCLDMRV
ncbi:accessory Sec system protein Asp2 [Staphylococcus pasteuri]|uniref:accessory Sec system protein Asp2 n=1 Tax=Staphylococcus pasteuri TaxID=45972 RepID=UPI0021C07171|nr:accessory Sec system protein Asp2 [Staphylococcus pasteuri]